MRPLDLFEHVPGCVRADVWPDGLIVLQATSNGLIGLAYLLIPISLLLLRHKRRDLIPVDWITGCFAAFILLCGTTHVMGIITMWRPVYWFDGALKATTAGVSLVTWFLLQFKVRPKVEAIPSKEERERDRVALEGALVKEQDLRKEKEQLVASQAQTLAQLELRDATIRELSTPILPLSERALLLPLIGALDSSRAAQLTTAMLKATKESNARFVILDLTGVPVVDTQVADVLLRCAQALTLLGAQAVITGIRADVAQTIVDLGVDLSRITTRATLPDGIRLATKEGVK